MERGREGETERGREGERERGREGEKERVRGVSEREERESYTGTDKHNETYHKVALNGVRSGSEVESPQI